MSYERKAWPGTLLDPCLLSGKDSEKNYSKKPLYAKMNPTSCWFGSQFAYHPVFLLADALFLDEKIHQSAALFWFGLQDVGIL